MNEEQKRIIKLTQALGLALGALEVIVMMPEGFSKVGVTKVINEIRSALEAVK